VLVVSHHGSAYPIVIEELARSTRILGEHCGGRSENLGRAVGQIPEITDRGADDIQSAR
jgi:hypothetical protein